MTWNLSKSKALNAYRDWLPGRPIRIIVWIVVWECIALISALLWNLQMRPIAWEKLILGKTLVWQCWAALVPIILVFSAKYSIVSQGQRILNAVMLFVMSIIVQLIYGAAYVLCLEIALIRSITWRWTEAYASSYLSQSAMYFFLAVWLVIMIEHLFQYAHQVQDERARAARIEAEKKRAQLDSVLSRLNPHFLYNVLNSISGLILKSEPKRAADAIGGLGQFLRAALEHQTDEFVTIDEETRLADEFIGLMQVRFGKKIEFTNKIGRDTLSCLVPSMILIPLLENAIKHGLGSDNDGVAIELDCFKTDSEILIKLTSSIPDRENGSTTNGFGIGLNNLKERLEISCGSAANLTVAETANNYSVTMRLPLER